MIKAVIFDMDGLMINSEEITFEGYQVVLKDMDLTITRDFYKTLLGKPVKEIYELFYKEYGQSFPIETVIKKVHEYMANLFDTQGVPLKKGLLDLLIFLKNNNYKTIVATSSQRSRVDKILTKANLTSYFDDSICGDEVTKGKPNPEIFLKACKKLNIETKDAIILEDSEAGIEAGYQANIPVYCVPDMKYPEPEFSKKAADIIDDLSKMINILNK